MLNIAGPGQAVLFVHTNLVELFWGAFHCGLTSISATCASVHNTQATVEVACLGTFRPGTEGCHAWSDWRSLFCSSQYFFPPLHYTRICLLVSYNAADSSSIWQLVLLNHIWFTGCKYWSQPFSLLPARSSDRYWQPEIILDLPTGDAL